MYDTVNRCAEQGVTHFQMIHDSYATHAADAPIMASTIREVFVDTFSQDVLGDFYNECKSQLPEGVEIPEPPSRGSFQPGEPQRGQVLLRIESRNGNQIAENDDHFKQQHDHPGALHGLDAALGARSLHG